MGRVERYPQGTFCWVDLGGSDVPGAKDFYGALHGWEFEDVPAGPEETYTLARLDGAVVAGMHSHPGEEVRPHWDTYISVDDVDRTLERVREDGGEVVFGPFDVPGTARMGVIRDPSGTQVGLWEGRGFAGAELVNETGTWTWNDLLTREPDVAGSFFEDLFGWKTERAVDIYASFSMGELLVGGMRTIQPEERTPASWMPYFVVPDADVAATRVSELGGGVLVPPTAVPAGRFLILHDPQGATSALFEMGPDGAAGGVDGS
jgi:predicted enzyme related to lactoylglutathione lyase